VEIEVDHVDQLEEALDRAEIVLLDNMDVEELREAVRLRDVRCHAEYGSILLEASGGVTLETVRGIAETGVDRISVGALTHSAPALDIGLDYVRE
jgi:nicotinate-nucleotide pyrophosphorylase (carboxylating)